jgi:hypothetical protein
MKIQNSKLAAAVVTLVTMVGLTGCVTPQIQKSVERILGSTVQPTTSTQPPNPPPAANVQPRSAIQPTKSVTQGVSSANNAPATSTSGETVTASKKLQELLEKNLVCPAKGAKFPIAAIREMAINERIIGRKPRTIDHETDHYPVVGNLEVYGFKVTTLHLSYDEGTIAAYINATSADLEKVFKNKKIKIKNEKGGNPGLWGRLPYGYNVYLYEFYGNMRMGCTEQNG